MYTLSGTLISPGIDGLTQLALVGCFALNSASTLTALSLAGPVEVIALLTRQRRGEVPAGIGHLSC